jgi:hypothetical protein
MNIEGVYAGYKKKYRVQPCAQLKSRYRNAFGSRDTVVGIATGYGQDD